MTIRKGQEWARPYDGKATVRVVHDDTDLANAVAEWRGEVGANDMVFSVRSGDVAGSLGYHDSTTVAPDVPMAFAMDLGRIELGTNAGLVDVDLPFVAHVLGHRGGGSGDRRGSRQLRWGWPELVVMNAPLAGSDRLGPRAHLNDGLLDVTTGRLPWRQALEARRRATTGTHLPHPNLKTIRAAKFEYSPRRSLKLMVDGHDRGSWGWIRVSILPDAFDLIMPPPS